MWLRLRRRPSRDEAVVAPGWWSRRLSFARAQASGARSLGEVDAGPAAWQEFGADLPRFVQPARQLLIEGQRTNLIRNPRFEGATPGVVGSGGVLPTHMLWQPAAGHTMTILSVGLVNGLMTLEAEFAATAAGNSVLSLEAASGAVMQANTLYANSIFAQITGGSLTGVSLLGLRGRADAVTPVNYAHTNLGDVSTSALTRVTNIFTTGADASAGRAQFLFSATGVALIQMRIAAPQLETGAFASTPVLPAVGIPGASTRGGDIITAPFASAFPGGSGTILARAVVRGGVGALAAPVFNLHRGVNSSLGGVGVVPDGSIRVASRNAALGYAEATLSASNNFGSTIAVGLSFDASGETLLASLNGAAAVSCPYRAEAGVPTLSIGRTWMAGSGAANAEMFGEIDRLMTYPYALGGAELSARVAALPT